MARLAPRAGRRARGPLGEPKELYEKFLPAAQGLVVTDPDLPASVNVATMLAAVEGWLPVTPGLCKELPRRYQGFGALKVAMDLRGKWKKNVAAYRWFYEKYGLRMSRRACANYDPGQFELRDYFVEFKIPLVWVSHPDDSAAQPGGFIGRRKRSLPANCSRNYRPTSRALAGGIMDRAEKRGVARTGRIRAWTWPANMPSSRCVRRSTAGLAAWATCRSIRALRRLSVRSASPPPPLADKVYYTYTRTDGDGMNFWRQVYRDLWDQPAHGKVPVGWQLGPTGFDLIPDILDYFYKHATSNDVFVNALTGVGYIREAVYLDKLPKSEQEAAWNEYMKLSTRYFQRLDLSLLTTFEAFQLMPQETLRASRRCPISRPSTVTTPASGAPRPRTRQPRSTACRSSGL